MQDLLQRALQKLDTTNERLTAIEVNLAEHMRRTAILESRVHKMAALLLVASGAASVQYWPVLKEFIKVVF